MKENKLITVLAALSKGEFINLGKFLSSPYFNQSPSNLHLYEYLRGFYPDFSSHSLSKEQIFNVLYPNEHFNDKKLRDRFTHFLSLVKVFLSNEKFIHSSFDYHKNLILAFKEKKLFTLLDKEIEVALMNLEKMKYKDEHYFIEKYLMEVAKRESNELKLQASERDILYDSVKDEIDDAICFFLIVMLKEYSIVSNIARHVNIDHKFKLFEQIIHFLSKEDERYKSVLLIRIFYTFFQIYRNEHNQTLIYEIRDMLTTHRNDLQDRIFKMLYIELYNHCKRRQSCGEKEFGPLSFQLLNDMLLRDVFLNENGYMTAHTYTNLVASGLREHQLDWTEQFIADYKFKVPEADRENASNYNYAIYYYMKGYGMELDCKTLFYNLALGSLKRVASEDFYYMTRIKNHALKIYYEMGYIEEAISLIDSYFHYLSRNPQIPKQLAERYHNFISFLSKLIRLTLKKDSYSLSKFISELNNNNHTEYRGWLLERAKELANAPTVT